VVVLGGGGGLRT